VDWIKNLKKKVASYFTAEKKKTEELPVKSPGIPQIILNEYRRLGSGTTPAGRKYRREYMRAKFGE
jgi:hypothetical protein